MIMGGAIVVGGNSLVAPVQGNEATQNKMMGIFENVDSITTNIGTFDVKCAGHNYCCNKETHSHLKVNVYMYVNEIQSVAFYIVCTAINACSGANINSKNGCGVKSTIYTTTGGQLERYGSCSFTSFGQMCSHSPSAGKEKIGSQGTRTISSSITVCGVNVGISKTCCLPFEIVADIHTVTHTSKWYEEYCMGGTTYNQFTTIVAEKYSANSVVSECASSVGNTTYITWSGGLSNCVNSQSVNVVSNGCIA